MRPATGHGAPVDTVVLDFDERYRRRVAMTGVGGLAFLLDLAEAAMLRGGDGLSLEDGRIVEVVAAPEPLAEIRTADGLNWPASPGISATAICRPKFCRRRCVSAATRSSRRWQMDLGHGSSPLEAPFNPEGGAYVKAETSAAEPRPS